MMIPVMVHIPSGEKFRGTLSFTTEGPKLITEDTLENHHDIKSLEFTVIDEEKSLDISLLHNLRIKVHSISVIKKYSPNSLSLQEMYPPSSHKWITHLSESGSDSLYSLQEIIERDQYLLSIVDIATGKILELHPINTYEASLLIIETDWSRYNKILDEISDEKEENLLEELLDSPAPSWSELSQILEGVDVPNLERGRTVRYTMNQLVPTSFPEDVRYELMAFLAYIINSKIPSEDPLDFHIALRKRFHSAPLLRTLVYGHIQCLLEGTKPPQYVRMMIMADRGILRTGIEPSPTERDPWGMIWYRLMEVVPNRQGRLASIIDDLNQTQKIITSLPITKKDARESNELWLNRFSMLRNGLMLRGYIQDQRLGLVKLAFIGTTHRWPHKHLAWSARLGNPEDKPPYIQVMVMPPAAAERILRVRPKIARIDWSASRINYRLYHSKSERWKANISQIRRSFSGARSLKQLEKEFDVRGSGKLLTPNLEEAKVLDLVSWGMYLLSLEIGYYYGGLYQISRDVLVNTLTKFKQLGAFQLQYFSYLSGLVSFGLEIKGNIRQLHSIARASLLHLPSATVMVSEGSKVCYIFGRVPEESAYEMLVDLHSKAQDCNLALKGYRMTAYVGYVHNLYQRLHKSDGTWDDDVSGFLSQIRS